MEVIRAGVVGIGHLGYHHARLYSTMHGVDLVGVADLYEDRAGEVAAAVDSRACPPVTALRDYG